MRSEDTKRRKTHGAAERDFGDGSGGAPKKEGTAKSRPFLTNHSDAAIYPGEVSASEQGDQCVRRRP
jgi:hypothetical protein